MRYFILAVSCVVASLFSTVTLAKSDNDIKSDVVMYHSESSFDDALFDLREAIINRGLVIDYESHLGDMLARTAADVGSDIELFEDARVLLFCSAKLSRKAMEHDLLALSRCPYGIFVMTEAGGGERSIVGYRRTVGVQTRDDSPLHEIDALLDSLAREAAGA